MRGHASNFHSLGHIVDNNGTRADISEPTDSTIWYNNGPGSNIRILANMYSPRERGVGENVAAIFEVVVVVDRGTSIDAHIVSRTDPALITDPANTTTPSPKTANREMQALG